MTPEARSYFELVCVYCGTYNNMIPVAFVLGFYVALIVSRWWEQFLNLPWPDELALCINAYCPGTEDESRKIRRTIARYLNLAYCMVLRKVSSRAQLRFPTEDHMVNANLMTEEEQVALNNTPIASKGCLYWVPIIWCIDLVTKARNDGLIRFDRAVEILTEALCNYRGRLGTIFAYDWINTPLVYTQTATIVVYSYFFTCLLAWQYLDPKKGYEGYEIDIYVPVFGILQFLFYMGWLKVAESLINPFGEDVDDFEIEYFIERNLNASYLIVDRVHLDARMINAMLQRVSGSDWKDHTDTALLEYAQVKRQRDKLIGSLANIELTGRKESLVSTPRTSQPKK